VTVNWECPGWALTRLLLVLNNSQYTRLSSPCPLPGFAARYKQVTDDYNKWIYSTVRLFEVKNNLKFLQQAAAHVLLGPTVDKFIIKILSIFPLLLFSRWALAPKWLKLRPYLAGNGISGLSLWKYACRSDCEVLLSLLLCIKKYKIGEVEKWNTYSIAYRLGNNCTKNYYNRAINIRIMLK